MECIRGEIWVGFVVFHAETQTLILSEKEKEANPDTAQTIFQFVIPHFKAYMMKSPKVL